MSHSKKYLKLAPSKEFGNYLRSLREQNTKYSQAEAARRAGISPAQLNYMERGHRAPSEILPLIRLAQIYHVVPDEIIRRAHWPQLILLPLVSIIDPEQLDKDLVEAVEKGFEKAEREEITQFIRDLLGRRMMVGQH